MTGGQRAGFGQRECGMEVGEMGEERGRGEGEKERERRREKRATTQEGVVGREQEGSWMERQTNAPGCW